MNAPLCPLGQVVATPGEMEAASGPLLFLALLAWHVRCDWGYIDPEDAETNRLAVTNGERIFAGKPYGGFGENCLWIITTSDLSLTTTQVPEEE